VRIAGLQRDAWREARNLERSVEDLTGRELRAQQEERLGHEVGQLDHAAASEAAASGHDGQDASREQRAAANRLARQDGPQRQVQLAGLHQIHQSHAAGLDQLYFATFTAGQGFSIPGNHTHEAKNDSTSEPWKLLVFLAGERGQPIATTVTPPYYWKK
jgi:hypothetical protein